MKNGSQDVNMEANSELTMVTTDAQPSDTALTTMKFGPPKGKKKPSQKNQDDSATSAGLKAGHTNDEKRTASAKKRSMEGEGVL